MSFRVNPQALREAADRMSGYPDTLKRAAAYNQTHREMQWYQEGLLYQITKQHNDLADLLQERLSQAAETLAQSVEGLRVAATAYEHTDATAAAKVDAQYTPPSWPELQGKPPVRQEQ